MSESLFGWDLLYNSVKNDIKNNQEILLCLSHLVLISNGFKCIGLGESKILEGSESKTESLPKGWNNAYAIRYVYQGRLYNLKATMLDDGVMINLIRIDERNTSLVQLNSRSVANTEGTLNEMIPDSKNIVDQIKTQLIDKLIVSQNSKEVASQTTDLSQETRNSRRSSADVLFYRPPPVFPQPGYGNMPGAMGVGRRDLDPFADMNPLIPPNRFIPPGGGGMLFNPPGPSFPGGNLGVAPGSIPPGARFDPFRPPDVDRFPPRRPPNRPDNDEMPPPGYEDMFM